MHNEIPAFLKLNIDGYQELAGRPGSARKSRVLATINPPGIRQSPIKPVREDAASGIRLQRASDRMVSEIEPIAIDSLVLTTAIASNGRSIADGDDEALLALWQTSWQAIEGSQDPGELGPLLLAAHREPQRVYHSVQHLIDCLNTWEDWAEEASRAHEVAIALWFHDAIYDTNRHDSEARSARWALDSLSAGGVPLDTVRRIRDLVIATRANENPSSDDARLINDIDLAIIGTAPARYDEYEQQLQSEHPQIADFIYRRKRLEILKGLLIRPRIYYTDQARKFLESQARENLTRTITRLSSSVTQRNN